MLYEVITADFIHRHKLFSHFLIVQGVGSFLASAFARVVEVNSFFAENFGHFLERGFFLAA